MKRLSPMTRFAKRFAKSEEGNVLMLFGLSIIFLVGIGGAAIDLGLQQLMRTKFQGSADAAATSAASLSAGNTTITTADRTNAANRYFNLNYPPQFYNLARPTPTVTITNQTVTVNATGQVRTSFVSNFGIPTLPATGNSVVGLSASSRSDFDVVMVVDETGSTSGGCTGCTGTRMNTMQIALRTMANNILPTGNLNPNVRMGIMGYASHITSKWGLSSTNAQVIAAINALRPTCNNYDHIGMQGGLAMLQGGTASVTNQTVPTMGPSNCQVNFNTTAPTPRTVRTATSDANGISPVKNVVFLTDGDIMTDSPPCADPFDGRNNPPYQYCYTGYSPLNRDYSPYLAACAAQKAAGAHVFVINFASPAGVALPAMQTCASDTVPGGPTYNATTKPNANKDYFNAPTAADLNNILQNVTTQIQQVRIIQ